MLPKVIDGEKQNSHGLPLSKHPRFLIKRHPSRMEEFQVIASYETWGPLASNCPEGGSYSYIDTTVYRMTVNAVCQALVEGQIQEEQRGAVIAAEVFLAHSSAWHTHASDCRAQPLPQTTKIAIHHPRLHQESTSNGFVSLELE
jgi:hypothetical protein